MTNIGRVGLAPIILLLASLAAAGSNATAAGAPQPLDLVPRLTSYFQGRGTVPSTGPSRLALRRLKVILDGPAAGRFGYHVQSIYKSNNASSTDDRVYLQDAYGVYRSASGFSAKAGRFVPPFGLERSQPDWDLEFVDRTDVTNRLVVDGNMGRSFARDQGLEGGWRRDCWSLSAGVFHGAWTDALSDRNGPMEAARAGCRKEGAHDGLPWSWHLGVSGTTRTDHGQDFSAQLPGLSKTRTTGFRGRDTRLDVFASGRWRRLSSQAEFFRAWFDPVSGGEVAASGAYGQASYLLARHTRLALRYEWFSPDVHYGGALDSGRWTAAATYDCSWVPLRLAADYSRGTGAAVPSSVARVQVQLFLVTRRRLGSSPVTGDDARPTAD